MDDENELNLPGEPSDTPQQPPQETVTPEAEQELSAVPLDDAVNAPPSMIPAEREAAERGSRGRARARQAQRKRQQEIAGTIATRAQIPRQLQPLGQFKMPRIRIPFNRALLGVIGAVVFIVLIVIGLGRLRNEGEQTFGNALWIGPEWTYETHSDADVAAFVEQLRSRRIGLVYAWVSWLQPNGAWSREAELSTVQAFASQFKAAYPDARLYGWVSLPIDDGAGSSRLSQTPVQEQFAAFSSRVVTELGFDGVFVNVDPVSGVRDGDQDFLALLRAVRAAVGLEVPIAAALPPDWSPSTDAIALPPLIAPSTEWQTSYKQSVALLVDQMAVMTYQSGYTSADAYSDWVAYQVLVYAAAVAELSTTVEILIGVPTYPAAPPGHDPAVENIESAVRGIRAGLEQAGEAARYITGVAIYAGWETDDEEWAAYQRVWAN
ncbi:MAG: hypothetical protein IPK19_08420 [Chloroflexi bacterium]|nr:hypothetical protein [Chloroflexota bacterium]